MLRYLKGTRDLKLVYDGAQANGLFGYSDSSWADDPDDRHSTAGYVYLLANAAISWCSRKQRTAAQSTTEAEYMALAEAGNQANWYCMFLEELGYDVCNPIPLHGDNTGSVKLSLNPVTGRKSKHILLRYHVIRVGFRTVTGFPVVFRLLLKRGKAAGKRPNKAETPKLDSHLT